MDASPPILEYGASMAIIGVGSNLQKAEAIRNIHLAITALSPYGSLLCSEIYATPGVGRKYEGMTYYNAVLALNTSLTAGELNSILKRIETSAGREHDSPRIPIDLDLVIMNGTILRPHDYDREYFSKGFKQIVSRLPHNGCNGSDSALT